MNLDNFLASCDACSYEEIQEVDIENMADGFNFSA